MGREHSNGSCFSVKRRWNRRLLERICLEAEILELTAHYDGPAQGVVIESELDKFRGTVSTFLIQNGTLKVGDLVVSGNAIGKIKNIVDSDGE